MARQKSEKSQFRSIYSGGYVTDYFNAIDEDFVQPIDKILRTMSNVSRNIERIL